MERRVTFYEETNFKTTEIGEIPADWEVVKLGDIFEEVDKNERKVEILPDKEYKLVLTKLYANGIQLKEVKYGRDISASHMYLLRAGDFIFSKINVRKGAFDFVSAELDGAVVSTEHPILNIDLKASDPKYVKFFLSQPLVWELFRRESKGFSGKERVKVREFFTVPIPLPPVEEQKAIAYVLSAVQEAREKTEKVIEATKELKKSLMKHLFTYGPVSLEEASRINLKETEIGEIPADWEVVKLKDMASVVRGISWNRQEESRNGFGVPVLSIPNIKWGQVSFDFQHFLKGSIPPSKIIQKHDIIFVTSSGSLKNIGRNCLVTELPGNIPIAFASFLAVLRLKKNVNVQPDFLYYLINSHYVDFSKYTKRASDGKNNFQMKEFEEKVVLPLPPLPVQKRIAEILQTVDEKIQAEEKKKQALDNLFNSMLHMLMSGKLRVKFQTPEEGTSG